MLCSHGKYAKRDIVQVSTLFKSNTIKLFQFVQLRKFLPPHRELSDEDLEVAKAKLAKEVLYEVPGQLTSYMKVGGLKLTLLLCQILVERNLSPVTGVAI